MVITNYSSHFLKNLHTVCNVEVALHENNVQILNKMVLSTTFVDNAQSYRGAAFTGIQIAMDKTIINFLTGEEPAPIVSLAMLRMRVCRPMIER